MSTKETIKIDYTKYLLVLILTALVSHFLFEVEPWLSTIRHNSGYMPSSSFFPADSYTYWRFSFQLPLSEVPINVLGPALFGKMLQNNFFLIFAGNLFLLLISIYSLSRSTMINFTRLASLIMINPLVSVQTYYINKEIYIICATIFLLSFLYSKEVAYLIIFFGLCAFTKPEFILISLVCLGTFFIKRKFIILNTILLILIISIFYVKIPGIESKADVLLVNIAGKESISYKLYLLSSKYYLFSLTIIPKTLNAILSGIVLIIKDTQNLLVSLPIAISGLLYLVFGILNIKKILKFGLKKEDFCFLIWAISISTIPFSVHRYFIPAYLFLVLKVIYDQKEQEISLRDLIPGFAQKYMFRLLPILEKQK